jgi:hypothetical protein
VRTVDPKQILIEKRHDRTKGMEGVFADEPERGRAGIDEVILDESTQCEQDLVFVDGVGAKQEGLAAIPLGCADQPEGLERFRNSLPRHEQMH